MSFSVDPRTQKANSGSSAAGWGRIWGERGGHGFSYRKNTGWGVESTDLADTKVTERKEQEVSHRVTKPRTQRSPA